MSTQPAAPNLQSSQPLYRILRYLALYLAGFLLLSALLHSPAGEYVLWLPTSGLSLLIGLFAYPYSFPVIWLASLLEALLISHQPIDLALMLQISIYAIAYGVLPFILDIKKERLHGIQTTYHTILLLAISVIAATVIAAGKTLIIQLDSQSAIPFYYHYVQTFLQELFGSYTIAFVYLALLSVINHYRRKFDSFQTKTNKQRSHQFFTRARFTEIFTVIMISILGTVFIHNLPDHRLLDYAILMLLPTIWLSFRFGTTGTLLGLPIVMIFAQYAQSNGQLDLVRSFETQVACTIYAITLTMLGTTVLVQRISDQNLVASQNKFDLLAETSPVGVCQINSHRELIYINSRWKNLTGLVVEHALGTDFLEYVHPDDHSALIQAIQNVQQTLMPVDVTFRFRKTDQQIVWLQGNLSVFEDPSTHDADMLCTVMDITTIKTEEEKLKGNETLLLAFVNGITDPAWMKDTEGRYLAMNDVMERLHNIKREDVLGKTDSEIWEPQIAEMYTESDRQVLSTGEPLRFEAQLAPNIPDRWYETVKSPILINQQVYGTTGISREITERRTMVNALRESEQRLGALLNNIPDLAWMKDKNKNFLAVNGIFCTTFHVDANQVVGSTGKSLFPEKTSQMLDQSDDEVLVLGRPKVIESVYVDDSSFETWYETIKMPMLDEKHQVVGLTGVARDITNRKRAEEAFQYRLETEKLISQISTGLNRIDINDTDVKIGQILERVGRFIHADRCYFIQFGEDHHSIRHVYHWHDLGVDERQHYIFSENWSNMTWLSNQLIEAKPVTINRVIDMPASAKTEMEIALKENITSIMLVPVSVEENKFNSLLTVESVTTARNWSTTEEQLLKVISEMISITLSRLSTEERLSRAETRYRMLAEQISAVVYIDAVDDNSTGEYISPQIEDLVGYSAKEILDNDSLFWQIVHPDDLEKLLAENRKTNETKEPFRAEYRMVKRTGEIVWVEDKALIFMDEYGQEHWFGVIYDITGRKEIENALLMSQARFRELFDHSPVSLWEEDFTKVKKRIDYLKRQGISDFREYFKYHPKEIDNLISLIDVIDVNQAALDLSNVSSKQELLEGHNSSRNLKPDDLFIEEMVRLASGEIEFEVEGPNDIKDGEVRYHHVQLMVVPGHETAYERVIVAVTDITERKTAEEKLVYMSTHDSLTGLYSRSYFETEMDRLQVSRQYPISMIMADIDYLKVTNDRLGHAAGDQLVILAARVLKNAFRPEDIIARIGGDEFAIIIPKTDEEAAASMVQRLRGLIETENKTSVRSIPFDMSIGVATAHQGDALTDCLKEADQLMYEDKLNHHLQK